MRLNTKIMAIMALVLALASLVFLGLFSSRYKVELLAERQEVSQRLNSALQITLENAMLKRDIEGLRDIVGKLGKLENVEQVFIVAPTGEVRFSSNPALLGTMLDARILCEGCVVEGAHSSTSSRFMALDGGREVMRSANAVANREPCQQCHGSMETNPVNGFLVVDYSASSIRDQAREVASIQGFAGVLVILGALLTIWLLLGRLVVQPVNVLVSVTKRMAQGDFAARHDLSHLVSGKGDEIAKLSQSVDNMAEQLSATIKALHQKDLFQQHIIDGLPDGLRIYDENGLVIAANKAFCDQVALPLSDIVGKPCYVSSHNRTEFCPHTLVICPLVTLKQRQTPVKCSHHHIRRSDGAALPVEVVAAPIMIETENGPKRYIVEAMRDLDAQMQVSHEQRLAELGQLAAGVAHEIHNPLGSIRFGLQAIRRILPQNQAENSELSDYLNVVDGEIDRCIQVTERMTRLTRLSADQGVLIDVCRMISDIALLLRYEAESRKASLITQCDKGLRIIADEGELGMVLLNLIQNAFHAMPEGGTITITGRMGQGGTIDIIVRDSGHGISADDLPHIFHPFWSRRYDGSSGSGLGLAICKSLVTRRGGTLSVQSLKDEGACFTLSYPNPETLVEEAQS